MPVSRVQPPKPQPPAPQQPAAQVTRPTPPPQRAPAARAPLDESTDQFDAVDLDTVTEVSDRFGYRDPYPDSFADYSSEHDYPEYDYPGEYEDLDAPYDDPRQLDEADRADRARVAELDEEAAERADEADEPFDDRTPGQQWLAVAAQLTLGVVGGAGVWLLFNWLWTQIPALALGAALLVIAGLVWIVRKIRKAEDLQTTVLAVLVGLVVTISPAALLLLDR